MEGQEHVFVVDEEVECDLTGLKGREGLWHARYPGRILAGRRAAPETAPYPVQLEDFDMVRLAPQRIAPRRRDRYVGVPKPHERVQVLERDGAVEVWWDAIVVGVGGDGQVRVAWRGEWEDAAEEAVVALADVRLADLTPTAGTEGTTKRRKTRK